MWTRRAASITLVAGLLTVPTATAGAAPPVQPSTRAHASAAMQGEALAHASYLAYAQQAKRTGEAKARRAFRSAAEEELSDHFTAQAELIGFVGSNAANLRDAMAGEGDETKRMYPSFARQARRDGCAPAAGLFSEIARESRVRLTLAPFLRPTIPANPSKQLAPPAVPALGASEASHRSAGSGARDSERHHQDRRVRGGAERPFRTSQSSEAGAVIAPHPSVGRLGRQRPSWRLPVPSAIMEAPTP